MTDVAQLPPLLRAATHVVWDFDGVIADTEPVQQRAYEQVAATHGAQLEPGWFARWVGTPEPQIWAGLLDTLPLRSDVRTLVRQRAGTYLQLAAAIRPAWFVEPALTLDVPHRIVSSGNHRQIVALLRRWDLDGAFADIRASDSPHTPPGQPKSERLHATLTADAVLFEDVRRYLHLGTAVGAMVVAVRHNLNDLTADDGDMTVEHQAPGQWHRSSRST